MTTREDLQARDRLRVLDSTDPLAPFRERFHLPPGLIYLDGNSLGPLPKSTPERLRRVVEEEWGEGLIRSWNTCDWVDLPRRVGAKIARLLGAGPDEVVAADSTSVNLFKVLAAALDLRPDRKVILSERGNFPTDLYVMEGLAGLLEGYELRLVERGELTAALGPEVAALCLTHVDFKTGALHDLPGLTAAAREAGALAVWDLAHSAGALPLDLAADGVELAFGCGYKYLNGGPGAPAFVYAARALHEQVRQPLSGWFGHAAPFAFETGYRPAEGISRFLCGTPPVLGLAALEEGVDLLLEADMEALRAKSVALGDLFLELVAARCPGSGLEPACPLDASQRGSQVSLAHPQGHAIVQALIARGVIGDFRAPDLLRFGFAPLYLRFTDVWDAVEHLRQVMESGEWDQPAFQRRAAVT